MRMSPPLSPQHKLLGPAVQHRVNSYSDQNLEALPAPFTFLGLQVKWLLGKPVAPSCVQLPAKDKILRQSKSWVTHIMEVNKYRSQTYQQNQNRNGAKTSICKWGWKMLQLGAFVVSNPASCGSVTQSLWWDLKGQLHWKKCHHWSRLPGHHDDFRHQRKCGISLTWL